MRLVLELSPELEAALVTAAADRGLELDEYALKVLAGEFTVAHVANGAELVAYWQRERLIGTRPDISDAATHARSLRDQAQQRRQPEP